jgi:hypothetical protein
MNKKDDEIQKKLDELESTILKEQTKVHVPSAPDSPKLLLTGSTHEQVAKKDDLYYFGGLGLIFLGLVLLFQHVKVGSSMMNLLGMGATPVGIIILSIIIGVGWLIYDSHNKWAWIMTIASCAMMVFAILSSLVMFFPQMTVAETIMMLLPFAIGGAFFLKGIGGPKGVEEHIKKLK